MEKYKVHFKPLIAKDHDEKVVVAVEVSGTFPGSPVTLDYYIAIENEKILSVIIN